MTLLMFGALANFALVTSDVDALLGQPLQMKPTSDKKWVYYACLTSWSDFLCWNADTRLCVCEIVDWMNGARAPIG